MPGIFRYQCFVGFPSKGWLTRPRGMYTFSNLPSTVETPTIVFVGGGWGDCRVPYSLSGGP
jgi:hypothetical protein